MAPVKQAADKGNVIQLAGVDETGSGGHFKPATRGDRPLDGRHDIPLAANLPAAIALIARKAQDIDKIRERAQGEIGRQDNADAQGNNVSTTSVRCWHQFTRHSVRGRDARSLTAEGM